MYVGPILLHHNVAAFSVHSCTQHFFLIPLLRSFALRVPRRRAAYSFAPDRTSEQMLGRSNGLYKPSEDGVAEQDSYLEYPKLNLLILPLSSATTHRTSVSLLAMKYFVALATLVAAASQVSAICPGFNYAIGNQIYLGDGISRCRSSLGRELLERGILR